MFNEWLASKIGLANTADHKLPKSNPWRKIWLSAKELVLLIFGKPDGFDLQIFNCWGPPHEQQDASEDDFYYGGYGRYMNGCLENCWNCGGTGIYLAFKLYRTKIGSRVFHKPSKIQNKSIVKSMFNDPDFVHSIDGKIAHNENSSKKAMLAFCYIFCPLRSLYQLFSEWLDNDLTYENRYDIVLMNGMPNFKFIYRTEDDFPF